MENNYYEVTEKDFELTEREMWDEAMAGVWEYESEYLPMEAIECLFKKNDWSCEFTELIWYEKIFYWFKAFICLGFRRLRGNYYKNYFPIVNWNETSNGECGGTSWECCYVGMGVFKNWNVQIVRDGT